MRIETAHKILIASAAAFFAFFGCLQGMRFLRSSEGSAGLMAAGGFAAAAVFAVYLRAYVMRLRAEDRPGPS
jgi:hypothetical protein